MMPTAAGGARKKDDGGVGRRRRGGGSEEEDRSSAGAGTTTKKRKRTKEEKKQEALAQAKAIYAKEMAKMAEARRIFGDGNNNNSTITSSTNTKKKKTNNAPAAAASSSNTTTTNRKTTSNNKVKGSSSSSSVGSVSTGTPKRPIRRFKTPSTSSTTTTTSSNSARPPRHHHQQSTTAAAGESRRSRLTTTTTTTTPQRGVAKKKASVIYEVDDEEEEDDDNAEEKEVVIMDEEEEQEDDEEEEEETMDEEVKEQNDDDEDEMEPRTKRQRLHGQSLAPPSTVSSQPTTTTQTPATAIASFPAMAHGASAPGVATAATTVASTATMRARTPPVVSGGVAAYHRKLPPRQSAAEAAASFAAAEPTTPERKQAPFHQHQQRYRQEDSQQSLHRRPKAPFGSPLPNPSISTTTKKMAPAPTPTNTTAKMPPQLPTSLPSAGGGSTAIPTTADMLRQRLATSRAQENKNSALLPEPTAQQEQRRQQRMKDPPTLPRFSASLSNGQGTRPDSGDGGMDHRHPEDFNSTTAVAGRPSSPSLPPSSATVLSSSSSVAEFFDAGCDEIANSLKGSAHGGVNSDGTQENDEGVENEQLSQDDADVQDENEEYDPDSEDEDDDDEERLGGWTVCHIIIPCLLAALVFVFMGVVDISTFSNLQTSMKDLITTNHFSFLANITNVAWSKTTKPCFIDSDPDSDFDAALACEGAEAMPCPAGAYCVAGEINYCVSKYYDVSDDGFACVLSERSNETLDSMIDLLGKWSVDEVCAWGGNPFTKEKDEVSGVPLFLYTQLVGELEVGFDMLDLVLAANNDDPERDVFVVKHTTKEILIGLHRDYPFRLPWKCHLWRATVSQTCEVAENVRSWVRSHVVLTLVLVLISCFIIYCRIVWVKMWTERQQRERDVLRFRNLVYEELMSDPDISHIDIYVRDRLMWKEYPKSLPSRKRIATKVWPFVINDIKQDNRIRKTRTVFHGRNVEEWQWMDTAGTNNTSPQPQPPRRM